MTPTDRTISIAEPGDVGVCRRRASSIAAGMGFPDVAVGQIAILVTELVENVIRHGGGKGELRLREIARETQRGLEIVCTDSGPGLDRARAFLDGYTTAASLGIGLGAVARLADDCEARTPPSGSGSEIVVVKWLPSPRTAEAPRLWHAGRIDVGARSRPFPGLTVNGDAYVVRFPAPGRVVAAVIDGLGHGVDAHEAAVAGRDYVERQAGAPLPDLFAGLERCLRKTRGAVVAVADIDLDARRLRFAGVGNVEVTVLSGQGALQLVSTNGIVGHHHRLRPYEHAWEAGRTLAMCSDGIRSGWRTGIDKAILLGHPELLAETVVNNYSRSTDDATVLGVRERE